MFLATRILQTVSPSQVICYNDPVYKLKVATYFLTEAQELGYTEAAYELARAHMSLAYQYNAEGGSEVHERLKETVGKTRPMPQIVIIH